MIGSRQGHVQAVWLSFLRSFIEPTATRDIKDNSELRCGCCGESINDFEGVVVILQPDEFPLFCKSCYERTAPQHDLGLSFVFTIQFQPEIDLFGLEPDPGTRDRGVVQAVSTIIAWYSATAQAYGLCHTVPSDISTIQEALHTMPEVHFRYLDDTPTLQSQHQITVVFE